MNNQEKIINKYISAAEHALSSDEITQKLFMFEIH